MKPHCTLPPRLGSMKKSLDYEHELCVLIVFQVCDHGLSTHVGIKGKLRTAHEAPSWHKSSSNFLY